MLEEVQQQGSSSSPYSLFVFAIKSPLTRRKYQGRLNLFFDYIGLPQETIEKRCDIFAKKAMDEEEVNWPLNQIVRFLCYQKERVERKEIVGATLHNYVKSIKLFCEMSDIHIHWKRITRGLPKGKIAKTLKPDDSSSFFVLIDLVAKICLMNSLQKQI